MKKCILATVAFMCSAFAFSQNFQDTVNLIEKAFSRYKSENPGCQLAIARDGKIVFSKAWGMADLEHNIPLTNTSVIEAGSVSKQFTAAAVLLLEADGKLSLDDDIRKYFPELKDYGAVIRLRHLLHHTSGIKDWGAVAAVAGWPRSSKTYSNNDALEIIVKQTSLNNVPGAEYIYSNSNYNLLALLVERVSGISLAAYTKKYIFDPAGMTHTQWRDNFKRIVPGRAIAYSKNKNVYETDMPNEFVYGNGGLLTTAEDLLLWNNYYLSAKLRDAKFLEKQLTTEKLNNGVFNNYAAALIIDSVRGQKRISHSGATAGYRAYLEYFPDLKLSVAFLANNTDYATDISPIENIFLGARPAPVQTNYNYEMPVDVLNSYAGWYRNIRSGESFQMKMQNNTLFLNGIVKLTPAKENTFVRGTDYFVFKAGKSLQHIIGTGDTVNYSYEPDGVADAAALTQYAGEYVSNETESVMKIFVTNNRLKLRLTADTEVMLTATYADSFSGGGFILMFERGADKKVKGVKVSVSRARNIVFNRK